MAKAKETKKTKTKMRRQIRKTVGALFMVSAIVVAAIPVQDIEANPSEATKPEAKAWVWDDKDSDVPTNTSIKNATESSIPYVDDNATIYTSGDGRFQFAYVDPGDGIKSAVILNYNSTALTDSTLTIPDSLEAFKKYKTTSTEGYYCLVTQNDEFMFYDVYEQDTNAQGIKLYYVTDLKDENGESTVVNYNELVTRNGELVYAKNEEVTNDDGTKSIVEKTYSITEKMVTNQKPCYYDERSAWGDLDDSSLYYQVEDTVTELKPNGELVHPTSQDHFRIDATVKYIGQQKIEAVADSSGNLTGWQIVEGVDGYRTDLDDGVFANAANITNLIIGENLSGISDYAFQGCATLQSVSFGNNLQTIGNGAFANCIRLTSCNIPSNANIQAFGKDAFYNCSALSSITIPINLKVIGDSCFEGCTKLQNIDLAAGDGDTATMLLAIGNSAFKDCSSLGSVIFPTQYSESDLQIGVFEGCTSLQYVKVPNSSMNFTEDKTSGLTFASFKETVPDSFYFWGSDTDTSKASVSNLHKTANDNEIAYKYWNKEVYEVVIGEDPDPTTDKVTYQVNDNNELERVWIEGSPENITIPDTVGPYPISSIGSGSFSDRCSLTRVTIPASITTIGDGAFKGCHNLTKVIFKDSTTVTSIGTDAFKTQEVTGHESNCSNKILPEDPEEIYFVGEMMNDAGSDTVPFVYAMTADNTINNSNQNKTWITCHSGWPTNLEVRYNYDYTTETGEAELQGYPRYSNFVKSNGEADSDKIRTYVKNLPYVDTSDDTGEDTLVNVISEAITRYNNTTATDKPTEKMMEIINASKNIVVPTNVDSIKSGLFSGYTYETKKDQDNNEYVVPIEAEDIEGSDTYINSITLNGVKTIDPFTFTGCTNLQDAAILGAESLGDYAFGCIEVIDDTDSYVDDSGHGKIQSTADNCDSLTKVTLGSNISEIGLRPFRGCKSLTTIDCLGSNLSYQNGILYDLTDGGKEIVECLEGRGNKVGAYSVGPDELSGVTSIKAEAFENCDEIGKVDLSYSTIETVPERAFADTDDLNTVILPDTVSSVEDAAFRDSGIKILTIPGNQTYIAKDAFADSEYLSTKDNDDQHTLVFECVKDMYAYKYANNADNWYITVDTDKVYLTHTVTFWDYPDYPDKTSTAVFYTEKVKDGEDADLPTTSPSHDGYTFTGWSTYTNIVKDIDVWPYFSDEAFPVNFYDWDGTKLCDTQYVERGKSATPPDEPTREGYTFTGWSQNYYNIQAETTIMATYSDNSGDTSRHTVIFYDYNGTVVSQQSVNDGEAAVEPKSPTRSGYTFLGWVPSDFSNVTSDMTIVASYEKTSSDSNNNSSSSSSSPSVSASASASASATSSPDATKKYTVSVSGGSGSGSYAAGAVVAINAYYMDNQTFDKWTTSTAGVGFASATATSTTFTMPAANVAITATYKVGSSSNSSSGSSSGTSGTVNSNSGSGTTVDIERSGISNTGLAGATVTGATDNFVIKITEDSSASDAVTSALQAKYGNLQNIVYFPMDISLYDSTGRTKIADTSGISVNLTIPIPDELQQYAGNNRAGAVANGQLEELGVKFTTVNGVPCINFTATHFSPYVIYVDTANLSATATIDATPKTGDPIHPKWFLAIGMACVSLILFFKKDKGTVYVRKVSG